MSAFDQRAQEAIAAEVHMISGSHDVQTSADVSNVGAFQLPDPAGKAGGACTSALLQVMHEIHDNPSGEQPTWVSVLRRMRTVLGGMGYDQVPQLTSSRMIDVHQPMHIVPPGSTGARRAILIGINYTGQQGQLSGCHNDAKNIGKYLEDYQGFQTKDMLVLMDDGVHHNPTKQNIESSFARICQYSQPGDVIFFHYSGELQKDQRDGPTREREREKDEKATVLCCDAFAILLLVKDLNPNTTELSRLLHCVVSCLVGQQVNHSLPLSHTHIHSCLCMLRSCSG